MIRQDHMVQLELVLNHFFAQKPKNKKKKENSFFSFDEIEICTKKKKKNDGKLSRKAMTLVCQ